MPQAASPTPASGDPSIRRDAYDVIIVGAGVSGLSLAALLAKSGRSVLVLEAIHYPGGCASSYEKRSAWFDVGATTFCGADPGQPMSLLFDEIGRFPGLIPTVPTLAVVTDGRRLDLTTNRHSWIERASSFFGRDQLPFWNDVFAVSDAVYAAAARAPFLPPLNFSQFVQDLPAASFSLVRRLPILFSSVLQQMERRKVSTPLFRQYADAQLLITNQTSADDAYMLNGSLGLSYANGQIFSVRGGMISFARFLEERARAFGADVAYRQRVTGIRRSGGEWEVQTAKKVSLRAATVVTQLPLHNLPALTDGEVEQYFSSVIRSIAEAGVSQWGAVTVNALIRDDLPAGFPVNLQAVLDQPLPSLGSSTLFCTFSHEKDRERCPSGFRTLSVSTHVSPDWLPEDMSTGAYAELKARCRDEILAALRRSVPELGDLRPVFEEVGTPRTFRKYTGRHEGLVGGIPLSKKVFPWKYPGPVTPFKGLFTMGDTFFPGQGIPGVVLGALGIHRRITRGDRSA